MPAGGESQFSAAVELEKVLPNVPALFDRDDTFYSQVEKRPVEVVSARDMRIPLELRTGGLFGYFDPDGGDLGRGDTPTTDKAVINTVHMEHAVEWTKKAEWSTDDKRKAVLNTFRHLLAKSMSEFRRNVDSQCMTPGNGVLGTITTVAIDGANDVYTLTTDGYGARLLRYGQPVSVYAANLLTNRSAAVTQANAKIVFYDLANKTIKIKSVGGSIATDLLVTWGLTATPPVGLFGVPYHDSNASTGSWLGFDRATTPEIRANRVNANGSALTLPLPRLALNLVGDRVGKSDGKQRNFQAWMHPGQQQAYEELGFQAILINKEAKEQGLDLYFNDNMRMAGAPVKTSYSWDRKRIDFIELSNWGRAEMHKPGFYEVPENDGGSPRRIFEIRGASGGVATSQIFYITASFNLFVQNPAACSYIDNLAVPAGY